MFNITSFKNKNLYIVICFLIFLIFLSKNANTLENKYNEAVYSNEKKIEGFNSNNENKIKSYNKTLTDYLAYQKKKNPSLNLLKMANGIKKVISSNQKENFSNSGKKNNCSNNSNNNSKKKKNKNNIILEKFNNNINQEAEEETIEEEIIEEEINNKVDKNTKEKIKNELKINNIEEEDNDEDNTNELDDNILGYFKFMFKYLYEHAINLYNKYLKNIVSKKQIQLTKDDDTLVGAGILFVVLSMGFYFIDITL